MGVPQIEVAFDIDANGIVNVSAKDLGTGKEQKITITASSGLARDEVERMVSDAGSHAEEDKTARDAADARNRTDQLVYTTEKTLTENAAKLSDSDQQEAREALQQAKDALQSGDVAAMGTSAERLEKAAHRLAEAIYRSQGAEGGAAGAAEGEAAGASAPSSQGEEVIDAEVVDSGESKA